MTKAEFKEKLLSVKANEFKLSDGENVSDYLQDMLKHIGDTDSELRDRLIYSAFYCWIEKYEYLTEKQMSDLFDLMLTDQYLFYNIDKKDETSVFTRTFSILVFNPILTVHEEKQFLTEEQMSAFRAAMLRYIELEHDFRGHVAEYGWAHAFAHWSDNTYFMTMNLEACEPVCKDVLDMIQKRYLDITIPLSYEEDERITTNIIYTYIHDKMIQPETFENWLAGFKKVFDMEHPIHKYTIKINVKNFLRCMYFRMKHLEIGEEYLKPLIALEKEFNNYLYNFE